MTIFAEGSTMKFFFEILRKTQQTKNLHVTEN